MMRRKTGRIHATQRSGEYPALLIAGGGLLLPDKRHKEMMLCNGLL